MKALPPFSLALGVAFLLLLGLFNLGSGLRGYTLGKTSTKHDLERTISIIGSLSDETFGEFLRELKSLENSGSTPIYLDMYSHGGEEAAGLAYSSAIRQCACDIVITVYGYCQSTAVLILASGDYRRITKEARVMVHESKEQLKGRTTALERAIEASRLQERHWNNLLAGYTKVSADYWGSLHAEETYLSAEECLEVGLVDEII